MYTVCSETCYIYLYKIDIVMYIYISSFDAYDMCIPYISHIVIVIMFKEEKKRNRTCIYVYIYIYLYIHATV